jgi:hypothetical protein
MTVLCTADIHLTDNPRDEYRWSLLSWLGEQGADELIVAGDITNAKNRHDAILVNRMAKEFRKLSRKFKKIWILKGNHDYYDADNPFFEFLSDEGYNIAFVSSRLITGSSIGTIFFIPAGAGWDDIPKVDFIFTHATFNGAKAENGTLLPGIDPGILRDFGGKCYSGDIHVPQDVNKRITYIGAPYHVRFGDRFKPRVLHIYDDGETEDLYFPAPKKFVFDIVQPEDLLEERAKKGDHVKVRCHLRRPEYAKWRDYQKQIRDIAVKREWLLYGAEPIAIDVLVKPGGPQQTQARQSADELMVSYAKKHKAGDDYLSIGRNLFSGQS